jgi:hypothetical protein
MRLMSEINIRALAGNIRAQTTGKKAAEGHALISEINIRATTIRKKKAEGDGLMSEIGIRATKECASTAG